MLNPELRGGRVDKQIAFCFGHPAHINRVVTLKVPMPSSYEDLVRRAYIGVDPFEELGRIDDGFEVVEHEERCAQGCFHQRLGEVLSGLEALVLRRRWRG